MKKENYSSISTEVLVLHELDGSERMGRVCRTLKYRPKMVRRSNGTDSQMKNVSEPITGVNAKDTEVPSKRHMCELCGVEYVKKQSLRSHMMIHTGETPYKCKLCGKGFRRSDWLAQHMGTHREPGDKMMAKKKKQYACDQCEKTFPRRGDFLSHMRTHTGERPYLCPICDKRFYNDGCLKRHFVCHADVRPYTCSDCGHGFKRSSVLNKHKRIHTGEKLYSCSICSKEFRYKYSLTLHQKNSVCKNVKSDRYSQAGPSRSSRLRILLRAGLSVCRNRINAVSDAGYMNFRIMDIEAELSDCEDEQTTVEATPWVKPTRKEPSPVLVLNEMEEAERVGRFCRTLKYKPKSGCRSNEMDLNAEKVSTLSADMTKDDNETSEHKKHVCRLCGTEYARKANLVSHMRIHTGETPYKCELCGKSFRRSDWLLQHINMHQNTRRASRDPRNRRCYSCEFCEKKYHCGKAFQRHVRTHTGERPYPCAICEKRFYDEGCLKTHLMCHSDDRPYTCSDCGHSFKRLGTLTKHRRIHTGEKAYSCRTCGKRFRYKYSVTLHLKSRCARRS